MIFSRSSKNVYLAIFKNVCRKPPVWRNDRSCPQLCRSWTSKYHVIWSLFIAFQTKELNKHTQFCSILFHCLTKRQNFKIIGLVMHYICQSQHCSKFDNERLCPSGGQRCGRHMEQFFASHCYKHPVLLSLKNNLKTSGFMTDNAAKAKCPVWGKGSKWKMNIGASWCVDHDEVEVEVWSLFSSSKTELHIIYVTKIKL